MSSIQLTEDQHVRHIVEVLTGEFDSLLPAEQITVEAERTYVDLREPSRVEPFVPILALRRARANLAAKAERADGQEHPGRGPVVDSAEHEPR